MILSVLPAPPDSTCRLCPRECGADRAAGETGICGETATLRLGSVGPHMGEEPCLSGTRGSGAFFFRGCACHCFFCQNWQISEPRRPGGETDPNEFHRLALDLLQRGVHNLNFVTPDHVWPHIETLCRRLRGEGVELPFVFNSSGYHLPAMIPRYADAMDIFLPDFKFSDADLAQQILGDARYPRLARESLHAMVAAKGFLEPFDPENHEPAVRGVLVRHLVLPGHVDNSLGVLEDLRREFGRWLPLSLMSQYTPVPASRGRPPFDRPLTAAEYQRVLDRALDLGFENLLVQPLSNSTDFLPDFDHDLPFRGNPAPSPVGPKPKKADPAPPSSPKGRGPG